MTTAEAITLALGGRWTNGSGSAFCPAHNNHRTPALSLADGKAGRLLVFCFSGCTFAEIAAALRRKGLFDPGVASANLRLPSLAASRVQVDRRQDALNLWWRAEPIEGTLVEHYLDKRGLGLPHTTESLRFSPRCWHSRSEGYLPAMLAKVVIGDAIVAVQRTYLSPSGEKAAVDPPRKTLGRTSGGAVKISDSAGPLIVAEGIETALAFDSEYSRVWATLGVAGMAKLELPPADIATFDHLLIAADGDDAGLRAATVLASRAKGLGWTVSIDAAPEGLDWADIAFRQRHPSRDEGTPA